MKRMLICLGSMIIGGAEAVLINLLKRFDPNEYEIDLVLGEKKGEFLQLIPSYVNVIDSTDIGLFYGSAKSILLKELKKGKLFSAMKIYYYWKKRDIRRFNYCYKRVQHMKYDIAIAYSSWQTILVEFINNYVDATNKLVFVHNQPAMNDSVPGTMLIDETMQCINNYTHICGVSETVTQEFRSLCPQFADKCITVYNFMDEDSILTRANEDIDEMKESGIIKILSVGRFIAQKNFTVIPSVCEELTKRNIDFKWYIVGDGDEKEIVQKVIDENGLNDRLILLGAKTNPYPYFKASDIYCQPSRSEAYCTTINEARILGKPIVATEFPGIREQLSDGQGGIIADNNAVALADGIEKFARMSEEEREEMLAIAAYPNALERAAQNRFFEIIGQK